MNILFVLADQHHAGLMGCAGHAQVLTPHLDAFAAGGVRFHNAFCQNPICTPSRTSILSGQYLHNFGLYGLSGPVPRLPSFLGHFRQNGYRTGAWGKLHLPNDPRNWIEGDVDVFGDAYESVDGKHGDTVFMDSLKERGLRELEDSWYNTFGTYGQGTLSLDAMPSRLPYENTMEMWAAREAMKFMQESKQNEQPFCIEVAFHRPHHPLLPQQQFWDLYPENLALPPTFNQAPDQRPPHFQAMWQHFRNTQWEYAQPGDSWEDGARRAWRGTLACVSQMDDIFGQLMRFLDENKLAENTVVIYGSDHGCYHGIHGLPEKAPGICSDAVCRVPFLWRVPGMTPKGTTSTQLVENVDIAPTITSVCGLPPMETTDGHDISGLLRGENTPVREVAVTENPWSKSLRWKQWRFVHYQPAMFGGEDVGELYDMEADPDETANLYHDAAHRKTVDKCRRLLLEWLIATTRTASVWPSAGGGMSTSYETVGDGKQSNQSGAANAVRRGQLNYI